MVQIENGTLVIGVLTQPDLYEKTVSNMVECKSRGACLMERDYVSVAKGLDVDKPRNLAKSVTVE